jgi:hypothetical protein
MQGYNPRIFLMIGSTKDVIDQQHYLVVVPLKFDLILLSSNLSPFLVDDVNCLIPLTQVGFFLKKN